MKRFILFLLVMGLVFAGVAGCWAEEEKPTAGVELGVFTKYIWRGYELSNDSLVIQPSVSVGYKGFGFSLWGNLDTRFDDGAGERSAQFNETDMTLSYDTSFGPWNLGMGYIYYGLDGIPDTQELYLSLGYDTLLAPTLTVYRDIAHITGWYLNFGLSHSFELSKDITLDLAGSIGYYISNDRDFVEIDSHLNAATEKYKDFHDGLLTASLNIPLNRYFTLSPMVGYSFPLSSKAKYLLRSTSFNDDSDFFFGALTLS